MARRIAAASLLTLLLAGCQNGGPDVCKEARATELPFRYGHGHLLTTTVLNGTPTIMVFDTGAQATTVTSSAASRLRLSLVAAGFDRGVGGSQNAYSFSAKVFQIGRLHGHNLRLRANNMEFASADGLLGDDFLAAYDVDLDLPERKAILFRTLQGCSRPSSALTGELYGVPMVRSSTMNDPRPLVHVQIGGKILTAMVDSGAASTLIFRNAASRLGLHLDALQSDRHFRAGGIGPDRVNAVRHVMTPITIGDLTIENLPAAIVDQRSFDDSDMLLGLDFLSRVHVWFSFSSHTLVMQYPPLASPAAR